MAVKNTDILIQYSGTRLHVSRHSVRTLYSDLQLAIEQPVQRVSLGVSQCRGRLAQQMHQEAEAPPLAVRLFR